MACSLRRAGRHDILARRAQLAVHPLPAQVAVIVRSGVDDRGRDPSLHRDGGRSPVRRFARPEHDRVRLLSAARLSAAAATEGHPLAEAVPAGDRQSGCLRRAAIDSDQADRLGSGASAVRPDDQVHHGVAPGNGRNRSHSTVLHQEERAAPDLQGIRRAGQGIKTIFLCRYLHSEELRREINEGLNVVEQWNGATDFVFFARRGEMVSNRREDHEISMLALHLIQNCMVYINTLMIQKVLAQPHWQGKLTPRDYAALTPLIWEHVNPYGRFDLDMNARLALL